MSDLEPVYRALQALLLPYAAHLDAKIDTPSELYLDTRHLQGGKPLFFGAVKIRKNAVSYHLMPVYLDPGLLDGLSVRLQKRMQGKSCFSFAQMDEELLQELATLTGAAFDSYRRRGFV